ncbi:protein bicaudal D isoform X1 [Octopus bimaculoides]|uniref:Protein bicaudal D n=1 Tax=Octopus bimaculoides TaxID=37653 RepID=A0A0L8G2Z9_OCTBM|nr:protein bicaudal D isoform X1 [Octopus bimaculoides]|eukprot:XP_014784556.1 PREDICTED: protein bicaudal D-like [Octopus bimaculoides]
MSETEASDTSCCPAQQPLNLSALSKDELKGEVERLHAELAETTQQKLQAAQYGLDVLEEKQSLQHQYEDLESLYDATKNELECAKAALSKHQSTYRKQHEVGIRHEERFLQETLSLEDQYRGTIGELETELKSIKAAYDRITCENERLNALVNESQQQMEALELQRKQLRNEIKEYKVRENRNLADYAELEDENINLQKQLSQLRQSQVDYEALKHEKRALQEETDDLNTELEETKNLKKIIERNLEEALNSLQQEREQKHMLKKELDHHLTRESMFNLSNLAHIGGLSDGLKFSNNHDLNLNSSHRETNDDESESQDHPALKRLEADFVQPQKESIIPKPAPASVNDLLSEIHMTEVQKLQQLLDQSESEKMELQKGLDEAQKIMQDTQKDLVEQKERAAQLKSHMSAIANISEADITLSEGELTEEDIAEIQNETDQEKKELLLLKHNYRINEKNYTAALKRISNLQAEISCLQERVQNADSNKSIDPEVKEKLSSLNETVMEYEETIKSLQKELSGMTDSADSAQGKLSVTQDQLVHITEEMAQLYHLVCEVNGELPSRVMLDHAKSAAQMSRPDNVREGSEEKAEASQKTNEVNNVENAETGSQAQKKTKDLVSQDLKGAGDPTSCGKLVETVLDQIKYLRRAVDHLLVTRQREGGDNENTDVKELQEQIVKLKAMLSTKREQIATLRSVLKANKSTAEIALANLKQKYENEKVIVTDTMMKLRNELKALKEDAATFASLRAMFAQRCDEYVTQLDEMQRQLVAAEEEKKTLNSLLRMAIQQKLVLTQRLEDLEFDRERRNMRRQGRSKIGPTKVSYYAPYEEFGRRQKRDY